MEIIFGIIRESYFLLNKMSVYLLFGFFFAGVLHVFINTETIGRHLGKSDLFSVIKASLFGIPLPLCSCGVIPAALSLRKEGASKGAILSFLISTPTTGIDSILATYSLLGGFFALYRIIASFVAGVFSGVLANIFVRDEKDVPDKKTDACKLCGNHEEHSHPVSHKVKEVFRYAFVELLGDTGRWLLLGVVIGGVISYFLPEEFIRTYLGSGWKAMVIMLIVGIPMYVCATGSIPIAAALMLKGMNPGAAFVFLLAGPATNAVGITVISKHIGKKALVIYLFSIAVSSVLMGLLLDSIWGVFHVGSADRVMRHTVLMPGWLDLGATVVLLTLIGYTLFQELNKRGAR